MIVFCEECGGKYRVDPSRIKGEAAQGKCRSCGHVITIMKPDGRSSESQYGYNALEKAAPHFKPTIQKKHAGNRVAKIFGKRSWRIGLTAKFMFFILVPLVIIYSVSIFFSIRNMSSMQELTINKSVNIITRMTEEKTNSHSKFLAMQIKNYLMKHPDLKKEDFNSDPEFKKVVLHRIGRTGYTVLYEMPDENGIWRAWVHPNPHLVGIDLSQLKKTLGKNFKGFWKTLTGVEGRKESTGYYTWHEKDGRTREKYMACIPVEGTSYVVGSTLYLDELYAPVNILEKEGAQIAEKTRRANMITMGAGLIAIACIIFLYGRSLTGKIRHLSETADRISIGELEAEIEIKSNDEIEDLAEAVSRMQDSIRLSIERLRGRKAKNAA